MKWISFIFLLMFTSEAFATRIQNFHTVSLNLDKWQILEFGSIKSNRITQVKDSMKIQVNHSASPLIYVLPKPQRVSAIVLNLDLGEKLEIIGKQGSKGKDDFRFRIGLVYEGNKTLSGVKKLFAPKWVKALFDLAPEGKGIKEIQFYNSFSQQELKGTSRTHYASELLIENFKIVDKNGKVDQTISIEAPPEKVAAIWLSIDGDDLELSYEVQVHEIRLIQ